MPTADDILVDEWDNGEKESFMKDSYRLFRCSAGNGEMFYAAEFSNAVENRTAEFMGRPDREEAESEFADAIAQDHIDNEERGIAVKINADIAKDMIHNELTNNPYILLADYGDNPPYQLSPKSDEDIDKAESVWVNADDFYMFREQYVQSRESREKYGELWGQMRHAPELQNEVNKLCWYLHDNNIPFDRCPHPDGDEVDVYKDEEKTISWFEVFHDPEYDSLEVSENLILDNNVDITEDNLRAEEVIDRVSALSHVIGSHELFGMTGIDVHAIDYTDDRVLVSGNRGDGNDRMDAEWVRLKEDKDGESYFSWHGQVVRMDEVMAEPQSIIDDLHDKENDLADQDGRDGPDASDKKTREQASL